jgi:hypothetical protein
VSGPVWRYEGAREGRCDVCFREVTGMFVEGHVADNVLSADRTVCRDCYRRWNPLVVGGEVGAKSASPAYAHGE